MMKQTIKKIVSLLVVLCLSMSLLMLVACNPTSNESENSGNTPGSTTSVQQPGSDDAGNNSSKPGSTDNPQTIEDIKLEDRTNYNVQNVETAYMENSLYDVMYTPDTASKNMKGYLLGDVYNMAIEQAKELIALDPSLSQVKLDIFTLTRDTQGNWRNYNKAEVHPIMNKLLNYRVDSNEGFAPTEAELKTYGDVKLFTLLRESIANTKVVYNGTTVSEGNATLTATLNKTLDSLLETLSVPMVKQTLDATVSDFTKLVAGTAAEQGETFNKLYGSVKFGELAALFMVPTTTLPEQVSNMTLSDVKAWVDDVNKNGGFAVYFETLFTNLTQDIMSMAIGDFVTSFGVVLPENFPESLAAYTVGEVVAELQAMIAPAPAPAPTAEGDATTGTTTETEQPQKSFFAEFVAYFSNQDIAFSPTVTLKGQELINFVDQLTAILTKPYEGTNLQKFDAMVKELNTFVTTNEKVMTDVVATFDASGITICFDGVNQLLPSEAFAVLKEFLKQGETYQAVMLKLNNTTVEQYIVEQYMLPEGSVLPKTGVKKVDDFVDKYKVMTLANFINNIDAFQQELATLDKSLTLSEEMVLSNYNYLAENAAVKTFMATYGNMTQAEINEKMATDQAFATAYAEAMMTLYKNLKVKDVIPPMPQQPVA